MPDEDDLSNYRIGELFDPNRSQYEERFEYHCRPCYHELLLFERDLRLQDVLSVRRGEVSFGLVVDLPVIVLLSRFDTLGWSESLITIPAALEAERLILPVLDRGDYAPLRLYLIEANGGWVRAVRGLNFSRFFSLALHKALQLQAGRHHDQQLYDDTLSKLRAHYPHPEAMLTASIARYTSRALRGKGC